MDKNRAKGSATNLGGKVKEGAGKLTGDSKLQSEGKLDQAKGKAQNAKACRIWNPSCCSKTQRYLQTLWQRVLKRCRAVAGWIGDANRPVIRDDLPQNVYRRSRPPVARRQFYFPRDSLQHRLEAILMLHDIDAL